MRLRSVISAWILGGGIWALGMLGLFAAPLLATESGAEARESTTVTAYIHTGSWATYQHPSGKYTVRLRTVVPVPIP